MFNDNKVLFDRAFWLLDRIEERTRILEHKNDYMDRERFMQWDLKRLASEDLYQQRIEEVHPYIKQLSIDQIESMRYMTKEQYNAFWIRQINQESYE